jgi:hypothetical protein
LMAHNRPALPWCRRGRWRRQPNKIRAFQPNTAARTTLLGSCFAACAPVEGRPGQGHCSAGDPNYGFARDVRARVIVQPATRTTGLLSRGRERDLPGSQAIRPVPPVYDPGRTEIPRLFDGFVGAAPTLPTERSSHCST